VKKRLDVVLVERGLAESRAQAQALVMAGQVPGYDKPGQQVDEDAALTVARGPAYVSRGGDKLAHGLDALGVDPRGLDAIAVYVDGRIRYIHGSGKQVAIEKDIESMRRSLAQLTRNTRELQESVLQIRMLPIGFSFNRFPRLVHDLSRKLGKKVDLKLCGENTELDKTVLEKISDPLVHLVRNALDHGLESPEARLAAGKSETGTLELNAFHEGGSIVIEVKDDGAGLNKDRILAKARERGLVDADAQLSDENIYNLIFVAGFSTADTVSDVSGRGVGMDVVRRNINDLGGHVQILSVPGRGSTIRIRLPLTLAILEGQMLRVGKEIYVASLVSIIETVQSKREDLSCVAGRTELFKHRSDYLPVIRLYDLFGIEPDSRDITDGLLVVLEAEGRRVAMLVDELLAQQQVVIKSLETNFKQVPGLAGATIHGDGTVALILDVPGLVRTFLERQSMQLGRAA
jgi:two-component system chemotaxis sensor kinase CheA